MSSDEKESFEITDYDLETEFNPNRYRKLTKNQRIYGIFADEEEDAESQRPGFGSSSRGAGSSSGSSGRRGFVGAGGVSFVSAGVQQPVEANKEDGDDKNEDKDEAGDIPVTDSSSVEEVQIMPSSFRSKKGNHMPVDQIAGLRRQGGGGGRGPKGFEIYGIGAKLVEKMGFQPGKGLGKDLQGINAPIEAHVRKGRGAIGAYGREKKTAPAESLDQTAEKPKSEKQVLPRESKWQKSGKAKQKVEYKYVTADEVLQQKQVRVRPDAGHLAKVKVIDLTGPEQRILSGYHAISGQKRPEDEWDVDRDTEDFIIEKKLPVGKSAFDMPELLHNIELLKDVCEHDIFKNDRKAKYAADRKVAIEEETIQLRNTLEKEEEMIISLEDLITDVKSLTDKENLDVETAYYTLGKLKRDHPEEWELYQLFVLVPAIAAPLFKEELKTWNALEVPQKPVHLLNDWAGLLGGRTEQFEVILWEAWMPSVRQANLSWNVKDAKGMLNLVEFWKPMLPPWIVANIHDQILMPKIIQAVEDWDPLSDEIPIHSWIHPWIPQLGAKLEVVYPTIRRKLANALQRWHPSDVSGKQILTPWISVFSKGSMETFLIKNIVPKLQNAMQELIIHPTCQIMEPWNWVMQWMDLIPVKSVVGILETTFFPRWLQFLMTWLNQFPNFEEVQRWYTWWRAQFQEPLMSDPTVVHNLQKALEMIGTAIQCPGQPMDFSFIINRPLHQPAQPIAQQQPVVTPEMMADALRMTSQIPQGFRDLVRMKCEELGLMFFPVANKHYEGKQVYKCGNLFIYISANVIYAQADGRNWIPVSLQQLLQSAVS